MTFLRQGLGMVPAGLAGNACSRVLAEDFDPTGLARRARRRGRGSLDAVPLQRIRAEAAGLPLLDEVAQPRLRGGSSLRDTHGLLDHHEAPRQKSHTPDASA